MENVYAVPAFQKGARAMALLLDSLMCTIKRLACVPRELEKNRRLSPAVPVRCGNIYHSEDLLIVGRPKLHLSKRAFP